MKIGICQISLIKFPVFSYFYFLWMVVAFIFVGNKLAVSKIYGTNYLTYYLFVGK